MRAFSKGREGAFDQIYLRYKQLLYNYFQRNCQAEVVDELFQEVWLRVIASAKRYKNNNRFRAWLFTLAHNCLIDHYRKQTTRFNGDSPVPIDTQQMVDVDMQPVDQIVNTQQIAEKLVIALKSLPAEQREAFYLREESGFAIKDIAEIQGIQPEAAKSRLRYTYKKLRASMQERAL
ncbi:MAG: sigma-70 family RNA polymerase sigma factor [Pseudomonadales bacterium]|nr:sigma-70 family RNA polymerase sigma factor [Pseudomonadales bacterium]